MPYFIKQIFICIVNTPSCGLLRYCWQKKFKRYVVFLQFYIFAVHHGTFLAAAAAKSPQSCLTLCDPIDGSPPGTPSLGFSRQEYWNRLPLPSPMHESEKWKWSRSVMSDSQWPHGLQPTRLLHPWDFPGKSTGVGCHCLLWTFLGDLIKLKLFRPRLYIVRRIPTHGRECQQFTRVAFRMLLFNLKAKETF